MKRALIACLALLFLGVFIMPSQAQAHMGEAHNSVQSSITSGHETAVSPDKAVKDQKLLVEADKETKRNCNGTCCGSSGSCCVSAGLPSDFGFGLPVRKDSRMDLSRYNSPPPGPGYPLLRPPRISA